MGHKEIKAPEGFEEKLSEAREVLIKAFIDSLSELEMYSKQDEVRIGSSDSTVIVITYDIFANSLPEGWKAKIRIQGNLDKLYCYSFQITARKTDAFSLVVDIEFNDFEKMSVFLFDGKIENVIKAITE